MRPRSLPGETGPLSETAWCCDLRALAGGRRGPLRRFVFMLACLRRVGERATNGVCIVCTVCAW